MTDYSDWLVQVTKLIDTIVNDGIFWVLIILWLNNIESIDKINLQGECDFWFFTL